MCYRDPDWAKPRSADAKDAGLENSIESLLEAIFYFVALDKAHKKNPDDSIKNNDQLLEALQQQYCLEPYTVDACQLLSNREYLSEVVGKMRGFEYYSDIFQPLKEKIGYEELLDKLLQKIDRKKTEAERKKESDMERLRTNDSLGLWKKFGYMQQLSNTNY